MDYSLSNIRNKKSTISTVYSMRSTFSRFNIEEAVSDVQVLLRGYRQTILAQLQIEETRNLSSLPLLFNENRLFRPPEETAWLAENTKQFFKDTPNLELEKKYYLMEMGFMTAMVYSPDGNYIVVGHSTGLIQMRHGHTGAVLATLRNIQYPPKPVYAIEFSNFEERICYAACVDGGIYRIEIPNIDTSTHTSSEHCIKIDPRLEWLNTVFFGSPGQSLNATPFISQRTPVLALSLLSDGSSIITGHNDSSVRIYDMETQEQIHNYKVHKVRLQFIPKKMQRMHTEQVVSVRCHPDINTCFVSAAWDKTVRVWDTRCKIGCMMTFEDVDVVHDAVDINRQLLISGSWTTTEGLSLFDLTAKKRLSIIRVQNRRPDVDGDYYYTCRFWRSSKFNRKGKYGIVGGSGTGCVEVINLHNRYITGSFPASGNVMAVTSYEDRIAFGGTAPVFHIVTFHDPKHEEYPPEDEIPYKYSEHPVSALDVYFNSPEPSIGMGVDTGEKEKKRDEKVLFERKTVVPYEISKHPYKKEPKRPTVSTIRPPPKKEDFI